MFFVPFLSELNPEDLKVITEAIQNSTDAIQNLPNNISEELQNSQGAIETIINSAKTDIVTEVQNLNSEDGITKSHFFILSLGIVLSTYLSTALSQIRTSINSFQNQLNHYEIDPNKYDVKNHNYKKKSLIGIIIGELIIWLFILIPAAISIVSWQVSSPHSLLGVSLDRYIKLGVIAGLIAMLIMHSRQWWASLKTSCEQSKKISEYLEAYEQKKLMQSNNYIQAITEEVMANLSPYLQQPIQETDDYAATEPEKPQDNPNGT